MTHLAGSLAGAGGGGMPDPHASTHEAGGSDEIDVSGLSGTLADPQTPSAHAASHEDGGADEIQIEDLPTAETDTTKRLAPDGAGGVAWVPGGSGPAIETVAWFGRPVAYYNATAVQALYDGTLMGGVFEIPRDVTFSKVALRSGPSLAGTFTARVCIYQASDGGCGATWSKVFDGTFTQAVGANAQFEVTNGAGAITLKAGVYALLIGRSSGTGSPWVQTYDNLSADLNTANMPSGVPRVLWDGGNSASSPPATINAHTVGAGSGDLSIAHWLKA